MKKLVLQLILLAVCLPAISQGLVYVHGTITDIDTGYPIPGHAVTIMTDSTSGPVYYNVVYSDSTGVYYDEIPLNAYSFWSIYIRTYDCQDYLHEEIVYYNPVNNDYIRDFQICSSSAFCQADFVYYPYPQGSPDSFYFHDSSSGDITSWSWSFGDGTGSVEQNPYHTFPGPGTFTICLTASGNDCSDIMCQDIIISDTVYHQLYGQVYAGNFPLQSGSVVLFAMNPDGGYSSFGDPWSLDSNGIYYFTLVPDGNYLILAIPFDSSNFIPTYFGDVVNWQSATRVIIGVPDNPYNIGMAMAGQVSPGIGSVSGQINETGVRANNIENINMILMNESLSAIGFSEVNDSGLFEFGGMDYGTYFLRAELPGVACDNLAFDITAQKPRVEVYLNFSGNSILGLEEINPGKESISIYPNPVEDQLNISLVIPGPATVGINLYTMTGQLVYHSPASLNAGQNTILIALSDYPDGVYMLRVSSPDGMNQVKKIIITR